MFDLNKEWSISFAGCGFMGIYYIGAAGCILERFPLLFEKASRIYGASAGSLMSAVLTIGTSLEKNCLDLMHMAREARKTRLGPLHPAFNLLQSVRASLQETLPLDAHVRAAGRLCVSLTRVRDGKNVLASEFDTREELIEALLCSCFIPFYCGVIPPTYRGVRYVDGAISDNLPQCHLKNTVTFSAFAGESDVCPRRGAALGIREVRFNNVSIHVNAENVSRVTGSFFPPEPEVMAEICDSGYLDALRFLQDNGLVPIDGPLAGLALNTPCCDPGAAASEEVDAAGGPEPSPDGGEHSWLRPQLMTNLPLGIKRALCEGCRATHASGGLLSRMTELLPGNLGSYLHLPQGLQVESACTLANRVAAWIPGLPRDMGWMYGRAEPLYGPAEGLEQDLFDTDAPSPRCTLGTSGDGFAYPLTPEATPIQNHTFSWDTSSTPADPHPPHHHLPLTPPQTPSPGPQAAGWGSGLNRAVGWLRHMGPGGEGGTPKQPDLGGRAPDPGDEEAEADF